MMKKSSDLVDYLILCAVFISPFKELFVLSIGIIDFKLPQLMWFLIFAISLLEKLGKRHKATSLVNHKETNNNLIFSLYFCMLLISSIFSIDISQSVKELIQYIYMFAAMYLIYIKAKEEVFMDLVIKAIILSNVIMVSIALLSVILQKSIIPTITIFSNGYVYINNELFWSQSLVETGSSINRLDILGMGPIGISFYIILQSLLINYKIRVSKGNIRILYVLLLCTNAAVIIMGYSRLGIMLFFGLNVLTLFGKDILKNVGIVLITVFVAYIFLSNTPELFLRIMETFNTQEQSSRYHFVFWLIALKTGYDNFLTGIGLGNMVFVPADNFAYLFDKFSLYRTSYVPTHNFVLQIWSEQGIIGLLLNLLILVVPVVYYISARHIKKTLPPKSKFYFMVLGYVGVMIYNLTNNSFYIEGLWEYIGLMYAMKYQLIRDRKLFISNPLYGGGYGRKKEDNIPG